MNEKKLNEIEILNRQLEEQLQGCMLQLQHMQELLDECKKPEKKKGIVYTLKAYHDYIPNEEIDLIDKCFMHDISFYDKFTVFAQYNSCCGAYTKLECLNEILKQFKTNITSVKIEVIVNQTDMTITIKEYLI